MENWLVPHVDKYCGVGMLFENIGSRKSIGDSKLVFERVIRLDLFCSACARSHQWEQ